jgi:hypothetical protein
MVVHLIVQSSNVYAVDCMRAFRVPSVDHLPAGSTSLTFPGFYFYSFIDCKRQIRIQQLDYIYYIELSSFYFTTNGICFTKGNYIYHMSFSDFCVIFGKLQLYKTTIFNVICESNPYTWRIMLPAAYTIPSFVCSRLTYPTIPHILQIDVIRCRELYYLGFLRMHRDVLKKNVGIVRLIAMFMGASFIQCNALIKENNF